MRTPRLLLFIVAMLAMALPACSDALTDAPPTPPAVRPVVRSITLPDSGGGFTTQADTGTACSDSIAGHGAGSGSLTGCPR